jgi:hypothetical protein
MGMLAIIAERRAALRVRGRPAMKLGSGSDPSLLARLVFPFALDD